MINLHTHSQYSLLDGLLSIDELAAQKPAIAISDHGYTSGHIPFYKKCIDKNTKPILGIELYLCNNIKENEKNKDFHILLLAKNNIGYNNLCRLSSIAATEGFYHHPRVDFNLLSEYNEGLICGTACLAGQIPTYLLNNTPINDILDEYRKIFKDNFYIEIQPNGMEDQIKVNPMLTEIANKHGIGLITTTDAHYLTQEDAELQDVALCISMNKKLNDKDRMKFECNDFYLMNKEQVLEAYKKHDLNEDDINKSIDNTHYIANQCNVELKLNKKDLLPRFNYDGNKLDYLRILCYDGIKDKIDNQEYIDRLEYELKVIHELELEDYFLICWDLIKWSNEKGVQRSAGRGSAAGSLVVFALGITGVDPIKYGLLFERFLSSKEKYSITLDDLKG